MPWSHPGGWSSLWEKPDYWDDLEYRVCAEMARIPACEGRGLWCDGFIPRHYEESAEAAWIEGDVWVCFNADQRRWSFRLQLREGTQPYRIDWDAHLPAADRTGWLRVDLEKESLLVDPAVARRLPAD